MTADLYAWHTATDSMVNGSVGLGLQVTRTGVACRSFYTHPPPTYTPHYPLQLPFTPPGSPQPIPYLEIPLEIPLAPGLVPMRGEVAAPPAIGPPRDKP